MVSEFASNLLEIRIPKKFSANFYILEFASSLVDRDSALTASAMCEISGRPIDNVYVKSSWPTCMSNFPNFVYNVQ